MKIGCLITILGDGEVLGNERGVGMRVLFGSRV